jgi:hypothetical protein
MKPCAMFLRTECVLPDGLNLVQKQFCETWMSIEDMTSTVLDGMVRNAGWHFMWLVGVCSSFAVGRTTASAIDKAIAGALNRIQGRFNAAELDSIKVSTYPGFQVARITLHARHIQQHASLGLVDEMTIRQLATQ